MNNISESAKFKKIQENLYTRDHSNSVSCSMTEKKLDEINFLSRGPLCLPESNCL